MQFSLTLVAINPRLVAAWEAAFEPYPEVRVVCDSILRQQADAWVTPTNGQGSMDGGLDSVMKRYFGAGIEARVKREIRTGYGGRMPVGGAVCVTTEGLLTPRDGGRPRYLISAATMGAAAEDVSHTHNAAWALDAALRAAWACCARDDEPSIRTIAVPGLGTSTGRINYRESARQMRAAYEVLKAAGDNAFADVHATRSVLNSRLATCGPVPTAAPEPRKRRLFRIF